MDAWITLKEAQECSYGKIEWWRIEGPNGERVEVKQHHPDGPDDRPIWCHGKTWMYLGGWEDDECHGLGVYYFMNGRLFIGHLNHNQCEGPAKLLWLPTCPNWEENKLELSAIKLPGTEEGLPYVYIGNFHDSEKNDPAAKVILKDGTTRVGPFQRDMPVGDWWNDHEKSITTREDFEKLFTCNGSEDHLVDREESSVDQSTSSMDGCWLTLEEARDRCYGKIAWWKCPSLEGQIVSEHQHNRSGPADRPVWLDENGCMYLGGWKESAYYHGFGVFYFPNGRLYCGHLEDGKCMGLAKLIWLPDAPIWRRNEQAQSAIQSSRSFGLPYVYIGRFIDSEKEDPRARVILKDGTTRIGPFKADQPVGNWWKEHEKLPPDTTGLKALLSFGVETDVERSLPAGGNSMLSVYSSQEGESWLSLAEAQKRSFGQIEWWKCEGPNGERVEEKQTRSDGPKDRPVWLDENGWMYLGSWKGKQYHGFGILYFPNGRVFAGGLENNQCSGPAKLVWLPSAPIWVKNEHPRSAIHSGPDTTREEDGVPYIYIGNFEKSERSDPQAKVILKDGTTRIGPFEKNLPVGNWWKDHEEEPMTSPGDFRSIASFGSSQESAPLGHSSHNEFLSSVNRNRVWLTFEEARKRSFGHAYWWRCTGANGETVVEKQHCVDGPPDHPVCLEGNGWMYFGGWKGRSYHGFGVIAFPNGRVFAGNLVENRCTGPAKLVWLPASPIWLKNEQPKSSILRKPKGSENEVGVPYIYIGKFKNSQRCDARATVILKDGTTRIGPFERDKPVGDWWTEHKKSETNLTSVTEVLSFATQKFPRGFHPLQRIRRRFKKKPKA